jgi:hypothetical protein
MNVSQLEWLVTLGVTRAAPAAPEHGGSPTDPPVENNESWLPSASNESA